MYFTHSMEGTNFSKNDIFPWQCGCFVWTENTNRIAEPAVSLVYDRGYQIIQVRTIWKNRTSLLTTNDTMRSVSLSKCRVHYLYAQVCVCLWYSFLPIVIFHKWKNKWRVCFCFPERELRVFPLHHYTVIVFRSLTTKAEMTVQGGTPLSLTNDCDCNDSTR